MDHYFQVEAYDLTATETRLEGYTTLDPLALRPRSQDPEVSRGHGGLAVGRAEPPGPWTPPLKVIRGTGGSARNGGRW